MHEYIISFFSLPFMYGFIEYGGSKMVEMLTLRDRRLGSSVNCVPLLSAFRVEIYPVIYSRCPCKFSLSYLLQRAIYTFNVETPHSNMPPSQCTWPCFLQACHTCNYAGFPVNFRYSMHFLLFSFSVSTFCNCIDMSNRAYKSIYNTRYYLS